MNNMHNPTAFQPSMQNNMQNQGQNQNMQNQRFRRQQPQSNTGINSQFFPYQQDIQSQQMPDNSTPQYPMQGIEGTVENFLGGQDSSVPRTHSLALLERYIGKVVKAEFLIGESLNDRVGRLLSAGENYIVLGMLESKVIMVCLTDMLKFVTVILDEENTDIAF